jgi:ribosome biogenesis GTPase A
MSSESHKGPRSEASWFPGHMAAGLRKMLEVADLIDLVLEVRDARLVRSTAVAVLHRRLRTKPTIVLLNRQDLAEARSTSSWLSQLCKKGARSFAGIGTKAATLRPVRAAILEYSGRKAVTRVAVVGAPNTGKSSVINALAHRKRTIVQNRAGVTRSVSWIALGGNVDVLDTPGVLEPRITDPMSAWQLGLCGILPDSAFDAEDVVEQFGTWLKTKRPQRKSMSDLETFARQRGIIQLRGDLDRRKAAKLLIKEFRAGRLGRITFEDSDTSA